MEGDNINDVVKAVDAVVLKRSGIIGGCNGISADVVEVEGNRIHAEEPALESFVIVTANK